MIRRIVWPLLALVVVVLLAGISVTIGWRPFIGAKSRALSDRRFDSTPERLSRGQYLTENLLNCFACHSDRNWTQHDAPTIAGTKGGGSHKKLPHGVPPSDHGGDAPSTTTATPLVSRSRLVTATGACPCR